MNHNIVNRIVEQLHPNIWELSFHSKTDHGYGEGSTRAMLCGNTEALKNRGLELLYEFIQKLDGQGMSYHKPLNSNDCYPYLQFYHKYEFRPITISKNDIKRMSKILGVKFKEFIDELGPKDYDHFFPTDKLKIHLDFYEVAIYIRKIIIYYD